MISSPASGLNKEYVSLAKKVARSECSPSYPSTSSIAWRIRHVLQGTRPMLDAAQLKLLEDGPCKAEKAMETDLTKENSRKPKFVDRVIKMTILGAGTGFAVMCWMFLSSGQLSPGRPGCCTGPYSETLHHFFLALLVASVLVGFLRWRFWPWLRSGIWPWLRAGIKQLFTDAPRATAAPAYAWTCHVCATSNQPGDGECRSCGNPSSMSMSRVAAARSKLAADQGPGVASHMAPTKP